MGNLVSDLRAGIYVCARARPAKRWPRSDAIEGEDSKAQRRVETAQLEAKAGHSRCGASSQSARGRDMREAILS